MRKIVAFLLIILLLGPTLAMACTCCPVSTHEASQPGISASDCCCSTSVVQSNPVGINEITNSNFTFSRSFFQAALHHDSVLKNLNHTLLQVPFNQDQSPHQFKDLPLYLSNLVLRI